MKSNSYIYLLNLKTVQIFSFIFLLLFLGLNLYFENLLNFLFLFKTKELYTIFGKATCLPDSCFCERIHIDKTAQPVNSITNIFYIYTGIWILYQFKNWNTFSIVYAYIVILLGIGSYLYHATFTFLGLWFDVFFMYAYILFVIVFLAYKTQLLNKKTSFLFYCIVVILSGLILYFSPTLRRFLFGFYVILTIMIFFKIKKNQPLKTRYFYIAIFLFILAYSIWLLDYYKILCNPDSLMQGHGIWHIINSIVIGYVYKFLIENYFITYL